MNIYDVTGRGLIGSAAPGPGMHGAHAASDAMPSSLAADAAERRDIAPKVNRQRMAFAVESRTTLLDALHQRAGLTGTKKGCDPLRTARVPSI